MGVSGDVGISSLSDVSSGVIGEGGLEDEGSMTGELSSIWTSPLVLGSLTAGTSEDEPIDTNGAILSVFL
jgi:hypothetical protein